MDGIFTYIYHKFSPNHWASGIWNHDSDLLSSTFCRRKTTRNIETATLRETHPEFFIEPMGQLDWWQPFRSCLISCDIWWSYSYPAAFCMKLREIIWIEMMLIPNLVIWIKNCNKRTTLKSFQLELYYYTNYTPRMAPPRHSQIPPRTQVLASPSPNMLPSQLPTIIQGRGAEGHNPKHCADYLCCFTLRPLLGNFSHSCSTNTFLITWKYTK